ncbi:phage portal protein, HK97 family [Desulforamulus reducens MI-1]|uniref:Phage portal protein, HK97 family n=1 Tax=Desulforamulus reducens (strain ATCC BAA-1160 / DSM 100696 / MI-1) TaxID=349161 RepID=A4J7R3_DESRM|nr:phage portal protein [Desulforamulus reducens]ABO51116.1 phage portal protein, HK97 family [Desulforamulus reducens MI-1]
MGLISWLVNRISGDPEPTELEIEEFFNLQAELVIRNLAFYSAINLIANSISKCEFKTYLRGKEIKDKEYYLFNVEPNRNQNSSQFIQKWITKLYENNECLIISDANGQLLVADTFSKTEYALFDYQFSQVSVDNFTFNKTFSMKDVLYFKLNNQDIRKLINGMYESYGKLISYGQKSYQKSRGSRGILDVGAVAQGKPNFHETFSKLMNERFKTFFNAENAVLPLFDGYTYTDLGSKTYSNEGTRDIKAMIDDIYDFTARAFRIPPVLLKGDIANIEDAVNNYLTFCIDPLTDMMQEEVNRKRNGFEGFKQGTFLKINTKSIKHVDLLNVATAIDKLISSGAFCINDIRMLVGDEPIDEPWAWQHWMTKNYSSVEDLLKVLNGGGEAS